MICSCRVSWLIQGGSVSAKVHGKGGPQTVWWTCDVEGNSLPDGPLFRMVRSRKFRVFTPVHQSNRLDIPPMHKFLLRSNRAQKTPNQGRIVRGRDQGFAALRGRNVPISCHYFGHASSGFRNEFILSLGSLPDPSPSTRQFLDLGQ